MKPDPRETALAKHRRRNGISRADTSKDGVNLKQKGAGNYSLTPDTTEKALAAVAKKGLDQTEGLLARVLYDSLRPNAARAVFELLVKGEWGNDLGVYARLDRGKVARLLGKRLGYELCEECGGPRHRRVPKAHYPRGQKECIKRRLISSARLRQRDA